MSESDTADGPDNAAVNPRSAFHDVARAAGLIVTACFLIGAGTLGVKFRAIPASYVGVAVFLAPAAGLGGWGFYLLLRATARAVRGAPPK